MPEKVWESLNLEGLQGTAVVTIGDIARMVTIVANLGPISYMGYEN